MYIPGEAIILLIPMRSNIIIMIPRPIITKVQSEDLVKVALGKSPADLVIKGGLLVDIFGGQIRKADVAIKGERIACVGNVERTIRSDTNIIDASDMYITPGLIDAHVHFEASMISPTQFARAVLARGNTTILWETLWTGNISGKQGIRFFPVSYTHLTLPTIYSV